VFNALLQILDDGRLTDSQGRTVNFRNTVIIMTSNIGSLYLLEGIGDDGTIPEETRERVMAELRGHFRPEFLNRVDEIVFFHSLGLEHMKQIIDIQIAGLMKRLAERKIALALTDAAKQLVVTEGYDPMYGARPLKRTLQRRVLDPLAMKVLEGEFREGDRIVVDAAGGELTFEKAKTAATA
jgi:ATP-dependent Clp protease ATP-binding subunit ClpB